MQLKNTTCSLELISSELSKHSVLTEVALEILQTRSKHSVDRAIALLENWQLQSDMYLDELRCAVREVSQWQVITSGQETQPD